MLTLPPSNLRTVARLLYSGCIPTVQSCCKQLRMRSGDIKRCLRKVIRQAKFTYDELLTAIIEVEMVLNSRPLSYMSADDLDEPLTPFHLIVGRRLMSAPDHSDQDSDEFEVTPDTLTRETRHLSLIVNRFWERWRREYLVELREAHKRCGRGQRTQCVDW